MIDILEAEELIEFTEQIIRPNPQDEKRKMEAIFLAMEVLVMHPPYK